MNAATYLAASTTESKNSTSTLPEATSTATPSAALAHVTQPAGQVRRSARTAAVAAAREAGHL